jgi:hypothetical protein
MTAFIRVAALAACLATCAVPATAAPGVPEVATFRAELKGVQTTTWSQHHTPQSRCDQAVTGSPVALITSRGCAPSGSRTPPR